MKFIFCNDPVCEADNAVDYLQIQIEEMKECITKALNALKKIEEIQINANKDVDSHI